jgi:hypothetical protein
MAEKITTDRLHQLLARISAKGTTLNVGSMLGGVFEMPAFDPMEASGFCESVRFALTELLELRADQAAGATEKPIPLPTGWTPTMYLRFEKRAATTVHLNQPAVPRFILQQGYAHTDGQRIWCDVPTMEE